MTHEIRGIVIDNGNSIVYKLPVYTVYRFGPNMSYEIPEVFIIIQFWNLKLCRPSF